MTDVESFKVLEPTSDGFRNHYDETVQVYVLLGMYVYVYEPFTYV